MRFLSLLIASSLWTGAALAQNPVSILTRTVNLPVVGLASSETAQVNVINLAVSVVPVVTEASLPPGGTIATCTGGITFYDANGNAITSASFTIGTGQIYSAPLPYSDIPSADRPTTGNGRTAVWATVAINGPNNPGSPCTLASNIETYDTASGVTHVHAEGSTIALLGVIGVPLSTPR